MNVGMISKRYAKALLEFAKENKVEDKVFSEMKELARSFANEPRLRKAMDNPTLNSKDKLKLMDAACGGSISSVLNRFFQLVLKNKREAHLQDIALSYSDLYCEAKHINPAKLITATAVDSHVIDKMKALLQSIKPGTLDFETQINPDIEGGFILFIDTYRIDASVRSQLKRIKQQFINQNSKIS